MEPSTGLLGGLLAKYGFGNVGLVVAGLIGALLSPLILTGLSRTQMVLSVALGFFCSVYGTPLIVDLVIHYLELTDGGERLSYGVAFFIGLLAMSLIPALQSWIKRKSETKS